MNFKIVGFFALLILMSQVSFAEPGSQAPVNSSTMEGVGNLKPRKKLELSSFVDVRTPFIFDFYRRG